MFIRGQKALRVRKMDYTKHPDSRYLKMEKTADHIPEWRKAEEMHKGQDWETETETDQKEMDLIAESVLKVEDLFSQSNESDEKRKSLS